MRRFELVEGTSSKFWEIELAGASFTTRWGRIGGAGQSVTKTFADAASAEKEGEKLIAEKLKKGYREVGASSREEEKREERAKPSASKPRARARGAAMRPVEGLALTSAWCGDPSAIDARAVFAERGPIFAIVGANVWFVDAQTASVVGQVATPRREPLAFGDDMVAKFGEQSYTPHQYRAVHAALSRDGKLAAVATREDGDRPHELAIHEVPSGRELVRRKLAAFPLAFTPDGRALLVEVVVAGRAGHASARARAVLLDARTLEAIRELDTEDLQYVQTAAFSPDGEVVALYAFVAERPKEGERFGRPDVLRFFRVATGERIETPLDRSDWPYGPRPATWLAYRSERRLDMANDDREVHVLDLERGTSEKTLDPVGVMRDCSSAYSYAFSRDLARFAAWRRKLELYDVATKKKIGEHSSPKSPRLAFTPDGRFLVSIADDKKKNVQHVVVGEVAALAAGVKPPEPVAPAAIAPRGKPTVRLAPEIERAAREELRALLEANGLARVSGELVGLAKPAVRLTLERERTPAAGGSRVGGAPDLPEGVDWPKAEDGEPLVFLAQIRLSEVAPFVPGVLPERGLLYFFNDSDGEPSNDGFRVIFHADESGPFAKTRARRKSGLRACRPTFSRELTLPFSSSDEMRALELEEGETKAFIDLYAMKLREGRRVHRMLGHAHRLEPADGASADTLLLELDSDDALGSDWAGGGLVHFAIDDAELARGKLERVVRSYESL